MSAFEALDAEVVAIAQLERDPAMLERIERFVGPGLTLVADPRDASAEHFEMFGTYLAQDGRLVTRIPGSLQARARLDVILVELAKMAGAETVPALRDALAAEPAPLATTRPEAVVGARWMWSHAAVPPGGTFKLACIVDVAPGWHVYGEGSELTVPTTVALELPDGVTLEAQPRLPSAHLVHDPVLDVEVAALEGELPLSTVVLQAADDLPPGEHVARLRVKFQACDANACLPPTSKVFELPLRVVPPGEREVEAVAGWQTW